MARIKIKSPKEIELIRDAGALAAETLIRAGELCKPGISTLEIDHFVGEYTEKHGGTSACLGYRGYPKNCCISLNEVVCHGIPGSGTILKEGDIVNIDITTILAGYHGDTSAMFSVGRISKEAQNLIDVAKECLEAGIKAAGELGAKYLDIGEAVQGLAEEYGYSVVEDYCGHGIGRGFHEEPLILHFRNRELKALIEPGHVFTIEPMINIGRSSTKTLSDGWTAITKDGSLSAQWEHTIARTKDGIDILTLAR